MCLAGRSACGRMIGHRSNMLDHSIEEDTSVAQVLLWYQPIWCQPDANLVPLWSDLVPTWYKTGINWSDMHYLLGLAEMVLTIDSGFDS